MTGVEVVLLAVVMVLVLAGIGILVRRNLLARTGGFGLCWRTEQTADEHGWKFGQGRYEDRGLVLYRSLSPLPVPSLVLQRGAVDLGGRRDPVGAEPDLLPRDWVIQLCVYNGTPLELALAEDSLTGLRAWVESVPPTSRSLSNPGDHSAS